MTTSQSISQKQHSGLHVVKVRGKHGTKWYIYAWRGGPRIDTKKGSRPRITAQHLAAAEEEREKAQRHRTHGRFDSIINAYKLSPEFERLADQSKRDYQRSIDAIKDKFGHLPLSLFNDRRLRSKIIDWRDEHAAKPRTADKLTAMMSTILQWAYDRGELETNVAERIAKLHRVDKSDEIWEERHWKAVAGMPEQIMDMLKLASLCGLRLGDLCELTWEHVHDNHIEFLTHKRKGTAIIPIYPELRRHLEKREHREGAILRNSRGKPWTGSGIGSTFQKHKPEGFDRTIHDLRGTFVTFLAIKGLSNQEIADIVGWTAMRVDAVRKRYVSRKAVVEAMIKRLT